MRQYRPLRGVRVLAFETAAALPGGTRTLADLGAEVVRIAERSGVNPYIRIFDSSLINKSSISIDLKNEQGRAVARRLAARADVVCNNFTPRVLRGFDLDYESLRPLRPDIIVLQLSGYGTPGPWENFPAYGPGVEAAGGLSAQIGRPDELPQRVGGGVFADQLAGRYAAYAIIAALLHRDRTGEGQYIDLSMCEAITFNIGEIVMSADRAGAAPERLDNRDPGFAPQGIYPCRGDDEWVALSVVSDAEWEAFRALLDDRRLEAPSLGTVEGRLRHHDEIDNVVADWTRLQEKHQVATLLQGQGIAAGPVQKTSDIPFDEQYRHRRYFQPVRHREPILGYTAHPHMTLASRFIGYGRRYLSGHRAEGAAGRRVLRDWIGMSAAEIDRLRASGAVGPEQPLLPEGLEPMRFGGNAPVDFDFASRLGLPLPDGDS